MTASSVAPFVLAALVALALTIRVRGITEHELYRARDLTLLGLLAAGAGALVWAGEAWLACIAASFVVHWRGHAQLPSLVCWIGIGGAWVLATRLAAAAVAR